MKGALRIVALVVLLPASLACLFAPKLVLDFAGVPFDATTDLVLFRYLGVANFVLFLANLGASARPSMWRSILWLDLVFFAGSALVPFSMRLEGAVHWFWWANGVADASMFLLVAGAAVRTFWMK